MRTLPPARPLHQGQTPGAPSPEGYKQRRARVDGDAGALQALRGGGLEVGALAPDQPWSCLAVAALETSNREKRSRAIRPLGAMRLRLSSVRFLTLTCGQERRMRSACDDTGGIAPEDVA